jgi:hypothetical protein
MRVECSCGAQYDFDVTPDVALRPVQFTCSACDGDLSESLTALFQQELAKTAAAAAEAVPKAEPAIPVAQTVQSPQSSVATTQARSTVRVRLRAPELTAAAVAPEPSSESSSEEQRCPRHPAELATNKCYICSKPICPKCMEVFGYLCSPLCKAQANSHGIEVPVYEGQRSVVEARVWRKTMGVAAAVAAIIVALIGVWSWYVFFGSTPKVAFSTRFGEVGYSGQSQILGKDQIVLLHGDTLARHDMTQKKEIWSR